MEARRTISPRTFSLEKLRAEHANGSRAPKKNPTKLPLGELTTEPGAFQMREQEMVEGWADDLHRLLRQSNRALDPLLVWWTGKRWVVMDGHHRLEAYRRHAEGKSKYRLIPVLASQAATADAALIEANRENSKDKLNTTPEDKDRQAWFLTVTGVGSKAEVAASCNVSTSTVARMRKVRDELRRGRWTDKRLLEINWATARDLMKPRREWVEPVGDEDDPILREGADWAKRLRNEFGPALEGAADIAAAMLLAYSRKTTKDILQSHILYELREEIEEEERLDLEDELAEETADRRIPLKDTSDAPF